MSDSRISVIVPVYNGAAFLGEALESVFAQGMDGLELVVVDDGSTDASATVAESFDGVHVIRQPNAGAAAARNTGLANTTAPLIAFLDADDVWPEGRLQRLLHALDTDDSLDAVIGQLEMVVAEHDGFRSVMPPQFGFQFGTALIRRSVFETVGMIDESMRYSEDVDWFMRARETGVRIGQTQEVTTLYRQHDDSLTAAPDDLLLTLAIKRSLDRRRASGTTNLPPLSTAS
ncbi:MAG: hypothetical protein Rubg2KO_25930 [Rubricoccaceae bacterium]